MKKTNKIQIGKLAMAGIVTGTVALAGFAGATLFSTETTNDVIVEKIITQTVEVPVETMVEVPVNVTEYVEVDNGNLDLVLNEIYDNDGSVEYLTDDLDDDELDLIVDRIAFIQDAKAMAVAEVKAELFDELDNTMVNTTELDDDDMERLRIDDDSDELIVDDVDYDNYDADVYVTGSFEQDDIKYNYEVMIEIKDNEVDDFNIISVTED